MKLFKCTKNRTIRQMTANYYRLKEKVSFSFLGRTGMCKQYVCCRNLLGSRVSDYRLKSKRSNSYFYVHRWNIKGEIYKRKSFTRLSTSYGVTVLIRRLNVVQCQFYFSFVYFLFSLFSDSRGSLESLIIDISLLYR